MLGRKWGSWDRLQREARDWLQRDEQNTFYTVFFFTLDRFYLVQLQFSEKRTSGPEGRKTFYRDQLQRKVVSSGKIHVFSAPLGDFTESQILNSSREER